MLLRLQPAGPGRYRALVGVGTDGCDPCFQAAGEALPLDAILATVPALVAASEARWLTAPRYPAPAPSTRSAATSRPGAAARSAAGKAAKAADGAPAPVGSDRPTTAEAAPAPASPAAKKQLALFG